MFGHGKKRNVGSENVKQLAGWRMEYMFERKEMRNKLRKNRLWPSSPKSFTLC